MEIVQVVGQTLATILIIVLQVYSYTIIVRIVLSWIAPRDSSIVQFLTFLTEPILAPIRKLTQPLMQKSSLPLDISPIFAFMAINIVVEILRTIFLR